MFGLGKKKPIKVMNGKRFIAAYSARPFEEAKQGTSYPDYSFHQYEGLYWCTRVGDIAIPWGFGKGLVGFSACGSITVSRRNVNAVSFDGRGLPYVKEGEVCYLYEKELVGDQFQGFAIYMRDQLKESIHAIARKCSGSPESFPDMMEKLGERAEVLDLMDEHKLILKEIRTDRVTI